MHGAPYPGVLPGYPLEPRGTCRGTHAGALPRGVTSAQMAQSFHGPFRNLPFIVKYRSDGVPVTRRGAMADGLLPRGTWQFAPQKEGPWSYGSAFRTFPKVIYRFHRSQLRRTQRAAQLLLSRAACSPLPSKSLMEGHIFRHLNIHPRKLLAKHVGIVCQACDVSKEVAQSFDLYGCYPSLTWSA